MFTQNKYGNLFEGRCLDLPLNSNGDWGETMNGCEPGIGFRSVASNWTRHREVGEKRALGSDLRSN